VNSSGQVGINTTTPSDTLDVNGNITVRGGLRRDSGYTNRIAIIDNQDTSIYDAGGTLRMNVVDNGDIRLNDQSGSVAVYFDGVNGYTGFGYPSPTQGINLPNVAGPSGQGVANSWTEYSSKRWKEDIETIERAADIVMSLRGVARKSIAEGTFDIGVIAEEVFEVVPRAVSLGSDGEAESVNYGRLVAALIEATKEQQSTIDVQNDLLTEMQARLADLEQLVSELSGSRLLASAE